MHWSPFCSGVIDVIGIDPHKLNTLVPQVNSGLFRQERVILKVGIRSPVIAPTAIYKYRLAPDIHIFEMINTNLNSVFMVRFYHNTREISKLFERCLTNILSVPVAMKWTVNIRACVGHHFDFTDLKFRSFVQMF